MARIDTDAIRDEFPLHEIAGKDTRLNRTGNEYRGCCPLHSENTASFTIFSKAGYERFHCFGCGAKGDVLDYVIQTGRADSVPAAARYLLGDQELPPAQARAPREVPPDPYARIQPKNDMAPPLVAGSEINLWNPKTEKWSKVHVQLVHSYLPHGWVIRHIVDGKKQTPFIAWDGARWTRYKLPEDARPIYSGHLLDEHPSAQVVILEGEKKPDCFNGMGIPKIVGIGFAYGASSWHKVDWTRLEGRDVILWLDADKAGMEGMFGKDGAPGLWDHLLALGVKRLRWVRGREGSPPSWNVDDAIEAGWTGEGVLAHLKKHLRVEAPDYSHADPEERDEEDDRPQPPPPQRNSRPELRVVGGNEAPAPNLDPPPPTDRWRQDCIYTMTTGQIEKANVHNWVQWIRFHPYVADRFALNEFDQQIWWQRPAHWDKATPWRPRQMVEEDIAELVVHMNYDRLAPKRDELAAQMRSVARARKFHPFRDYLQGLRWDGVSRLDTALQDYAGSPDRPAYRIPFRKWLISSCARIMEPGCKVDSMLILEGAQNAGKSALFRIMATPVSDTHFTDALPHKVDDKDAILVTMGTVIVETPELSSLQRTDHNAMKGWLSRQVDRARLPYAREVTDNARSFIVCGTVNPDGITGYLKDLTGNRRFWIVETGSHIDQDGLREMRDQLWAEAFHLYQEGEAWYLSDEEAAIMRPEQEARVQTDDWEDKILEYLDAHPQVTRTTVIDMGKAALELTPRDLNQMTQNRVARALKAAGWERRKSGGRNLWTKPR